VWEIGRGGGIRTHDLLNPMNQGGKPAKWAYSESVNVNSRRRFRRQISRTLDAPPESSLANRRGTAVPLNNAILVDQPEAVKRLRFLFDPCLGATRPLAKASWTSREALWTGAHKCHKLRAMTPA